MELQERSRRNDYEELVEALPALGSSSGNRREHAGHDKCTWDRDVERRVKWKFDVYILPWLFLLWFFSFVDRSNIGIAAIIGLDQEASLDGTRFNIALSVFHILYILVDIPSNWILKYFGGGRYLPILAVGWGVVTACIGTVKSFGALVACRLLLGAFEGAFLSGIILYLGLFYKRHELVARIGIFSSASSLSGAFGGLLATGLAHIRYGGYAGWPWIFFVEGSMTVVLALVGLFLLPNTPSSAKFLTSEEQWLAAHRLYIDSQGATAFERVEQEEFSWKTARLAILNVNTLLMSWSYFLILIPVYSFSIFLPTILEGMHYEGTTALLLTVPPNMLAFFCVIAAGVVSDNIKMRGPLIIAFFSVTAIGYIIQLASEDPSVQYAGIFFIAAGAYPCSPLVLAWLINNLAPHYTRATGMGFITAIGQFGSIVATFTYLDRDKPEYTTGHSISLGAVVLTIISVLANIMYIRRENAARQAGKRNDRFRKVLDGQELGHRHPNFRYTL